ncbi:MAG: hypothetical protein AAGA48_00970 [Myxococcota bacterium]
MFNSKLSFFVFALLAACETTEPIDSTEPVDPAEMPVDADPCKATELAGDFGLFDEANGPSTWDVPSDAIVASTYLRLNPDNLDVFDTYSGPVIGDLLSGRAGLLYLATGQSMECGVARTLTVWESEEAMMDFVVGKAHIAAIGVTDQVSRGGSITDMWVASELPSVDFAGVAEAFADHDGPVY